MKAMYEVVTQGEFAKWTLENTPKPPAAVEAEAAEG
jgi:hypothetical protein